MADENQHNYYEILEVSKEAPQHEIHRAYERAKGTYSSENPALYTVFSAVEARQLLLLIEEAYSVLGNTALRSIYDYRLSQKETRNEDLSFSSLLKAQQSFAGESFKVAPKKEGFTKNSEFEAQIKEQTEFNGEFLNKVREYKNISIEEMSEITRINPHYVRAVEAVDPSNLPAPVFVRGYVVQIAKTLGLDHNKAADSYMKIYNSKNKS